MAVCSLAMACVGSVVTAPALSSSSSSAAKKLSSSNAAFNGCGSVQQQLAAPVKCSCASSSGRVVAVRANLSEDGKKVRRQVLASLLAAGVAINLAAGAGPAAFAASGPGNDGAERTARKAGELLQDADKLIKNDSPPSYGPGRLLEGATENIERFSQQAGAGAVPDLQSSGSAAVQDARNKVASNVEKTKKRIDKVFQSKVLPNDAIGDVQGKADQTINKVKSGSNTFGSKTNFGNSGKKLVGDAKGKIDEGLASSAPAKTSFFGKIRQQVKGLQGTVDTKIEEVKGAVSK
jgi:hypothetical protein